MHDCLKLKNDDKYYDIAPGTTTFLATRVFFLQSPVLIYLDDDRLLVSSNSYFYFPIQKFLKIFPRISSVEISPVISPRK